MQLRAEMQVRSWNEQWARAQAVRTKREAQLKAAYNKETKKHLAWQQTKEAQDKLDALETILTSVLEVDSAIDWSLLIDNSDYPAPMPTRPEEEAIPREPDVNDPEFRAHLSFIARIIPSVRDKERARLAAKFGEAKKKWSEEMAARWQRVEKATEDLKKKLAAWEAKKSQWLEERETMAQMLTNLQKGSRSHS